jgi:hypothetical protein
VLLLNLAWLIALIAVMVRGQVPGSEDRLI